MRFWSWLKSLLHFDKSQASELAAPLKPQPTPAEVVLPPVVPAKAPAVMASTPAEVTAKFKLGTEEWFQASYLILEFDKGFEKQIEKAAKRVLAGKARYAEIEKQTKVPWFMIGVIHNMECNCNFKGVLHNGQTIVGTGKKTTIVPIGRGPFATWEASALDAIKTQPMYSGNSAWALGHVLRLVELFNGDGYRKYHNTPSPYVWACSNICAPKGKYVKDGKWDKDADTHSQVGAAVIIRQLELWGELEVKWVYP